MPTVARSRWPTCWSRRTSAPLWLLIGFIIVIAILDIIIPGLLPKWAIFAPVFIPLFIRLGVAPQTLLAAYRVGDSPMNVITPLMVYLPFIVLVAQRYKKTAGLGTIVSMMIPYSVVVLVTWTHLLHRVVPAGHPDGPRLPRDPLTHPREPSDGIAAAAPTDLVEHRLEVVLHGVPGDVQRRRDGRGRSPRSTSLATSSSWP